MNREGGSEQFSPIPDEWLEANAGSDILICPGMAGREGPSQGWPNLYPDTTSDFYKFFTASGLVVRYAAPKDTRRTLGLLAREIWVPVLLFISTSASGAAGALLATAIQNFLHRAGDSGKQLIHVRCGRLRNGSADWFEAHGREQDVLSALREWSDLKEQE